MFKTWKKLRSQYPVNMNITGFFKQIIPFPEDGFCIDDRELRWHYYYV